MWVGVCTLCEGCILAAGHKGKHKIKDGGRTSAPAKRASAEPSGGGGKRARSSQDEKDQRLAELQAQHEKRVAELQAQHDERVAALQAAPTPATHVLQTQLKAGETVYQADKRPKTV